MNRIIRRIALCIITVIMFTSAESFAEKKEIRVYWVGTSSTTKELVWLTRDIINTSDDFVMTTDFSDKAGYTAIAKFVYENGFTEAWLTENLPKIKAGKYTHVVFQALRASLHLTPEDQIKLYEKIFPEVCKKVQDLGVEIVIYDKHLCDYSST